MCYSNSSTSSNVQLGQIYNRKIDQLPDYQPVFYANGFNFPLWRIITHELEIQEMQWGLIPNWYKGTDPKEIRTKTLNARIETLQEKASFKSLINRNRCIIPSTGFFEFQHQGKEKIPYFIHPVHSSVFSMAGLFDEWLDQQTGEIIRSFSIITMAANAFMAKIHNSKQRMPLILNINDVEAYLRAKNPITAFFPIDEKEMTGHKVDKNRLLSSSSNIPEVQQAIVDNIGIQTRLF